MDPVGSMNRSGVVDAEKFFQKYEAMKEDYESIRKRYSDLISTHSGTANKLELAQEEVNRLKKLYEEALQETTTSIRERNHLKVQCTAAIRQWDSALCERNEYKDALAKVQQQHEEAMKEVNQGMARSIKCGKDIKRLTDERDAALQEYSLIMSERDSVHRELEKLTDDLTQSKKQNKALEVQNKELMDKLQEAGQEAEVSNRTRDWAFSERDKIMREKESLRTLCESLRRERDRAVSDLAEALSESEEMKRQKNLASRQVNELRDRIELEKENRDAMRFQYLSNSSSFSESRDSAIDSDLPSGHYSIKLPNVRGSDHGLVLEPGVYISRILPGSAAAKESNLNIGDRVLFINDTAIDNVQDAILALSEDIDPIMLTLSRSAGHLPSPIHALKNSNKLQTNSNISKMANHASTASLKSDKSGDCHLATLSRDRGHPSSNSGSSTLKPHGGLRDIFRVRLARKKLSSPEVEILETLDSAIASGGGGSGSSSAQRKARRKRGSSRGGGSGGESSNKNGTWPRVVLNRNSACSYTLPHHSGGPNTETESQASSAPNRPSETHYTSLNPQYRKKDPGFYSGGHYIPNVNASNTVGVRRHAAGTKERVALSSLPWDVSMGGRVVGNNSISVGTFTGTGNSTQLQNNPESMETQSRASVETDRSTLSRSRAGVVDGHDLRAGLLGGERIHSGQPQHHRYSFGVFDPSNSEAVKAEPQRNSVVPTLTMSDGSSIDFSVRSGNMDILEYYVKRNMGKNQNNSSESDHLDKVVSPPSLGIPFGSSSNVLSMGMSNTLNRHSNRPPSRYSSGHHHEVTPHSLMSMQMIQQSLHAAPRSIANSLMGSNNASYAFEPNFQSHHSHSHGPQQHMVPTSSGHTASVPIAMSLRSNSSKLLYRNSDDLLAAHPSSPIESSGTFPRKREPQRIRIPSNQSRSSAEKFELRNSPMPAYHIEELDPGNPDLGEYGSWQGKSGELRSIRIHKSGQPLGIQISCKAKGGGVFISSVTEGSVASHANLRVGSQILEICGINMRSASYAHAAQVLQQCKDTMTMLVHYLPEKYRDLPDERDHGSSSDGEDSDSDGSSSDENQDENNSSLSDNESRSSGHSGSPTPCNSPGNTLVRKSKQNSSVRKSVQTGNASVQASSSIKSHQSQQQQQSQLQQALAAAALESHNTPSNTLTRKTGQDKGESGKGVDKPRYLTLQLLKNSSNLGICLVGGNVVGIFVHSVQADSIAERAGMRTGDQILEYNGTELREATAEEAAFELAKPLDKVSILVQYNIQRYNDIKDQPGDGFYIRALFDFPALSNDSHHQGSQDAQALSFFKDEILYIDNTMFNGKPGKWRAWKVDSEGHRKVWGVIPSKFKIEEEMMFKRNLGDLDGDRRSSTMTRRSFFRRKSSSHTSRELASFSDFSINAYGGDGMQQGVMQLKDESLSHQTYQRVERLDYMLFLRPVIVLGALSDLISERLVQDFPYQFGRVPLEVMHCSGAMLEKGLTESIFVDYKRKGAHYECITMGAIKEISSRKLYCIMDVSTSGIERLQRAQMYPIVLLIKFKSPKQIREIKDLRCDKITAKAAKELYEHSLKVENEYKHLITVCVPGGTNISYLGSQVKTAVEREQSKTLWVPCPN